MPEPIRPSVRPHRIPIVVATAALRPFVPVWRASAPLLAEVGIAAAFIGGLASAAIGPFAPWFVLAAVVVGFRLRLADVESWALFVPGGLDGRVNEAFGQRPAVVASAAALVERLLFVALAAVVTGHYTVSFLVAALRTSAVRSRLSPEDLVVVVAVGLVGLIWIRARLGRFASADLVARAIWLAVALLVLAALWGLATWWRVGTVPESVMSTAQILRGLEEDPRHVLSGGGLRLAVAALVAFGYVLPALGTSESLRRVAIALPQPRIASLRWTRVLVGGFAVIVTAVSAFLFDAIVPVAERSVWFDIPLVGVAQHLAGALWLRQAGTAAVVVAVIVMLACAAEAGLTDAEGKLHRLADQGVLSEGLLQPHPRFGTMARLVDTLAISVVAAILASGGRVPWLAAAYGASLVWVQGFKVATLLRLRRQRAPASGGSRGLAIIGALIAAAGVVLLVRGSAPMWAGTGSLIGLAAVLVVSKRRKRELPPEPPEAFQLLPSTGLSLNEVAAEPGGILVAVRQPHMLTHVSSALRAAAGRPVVVMTARLLGPDADEDVGVDPHPTMEESHLFSHVITLAEQYGSAVRLLVVPARDVFAAIIAAVVRLRSAEVYVGESTTLPAAAQARLLGDAWERADKPGPLQVRLVIHHSTGRNDTYLLGAHAPSLTPHDIDLIHQVWLDATRAVGPHVHHHDVVRAALVQMAEQLNGPHREEALETVRRIARPADELAAVVRNRDFPRLRDMVRNLPAADLARVLTDLGLEDQVVVFRVLPRKDAAAAFEYLSQETQETLLKAMAQEDVASLLNEMAPDDRTMFLEELPANVTRQLLALLTPEERAVASKLLGYPEESVGRLMTPNYLAIREEWTVQQVLDYVRQHGQDSETLNVIYVVDDQGLLTDDIRIREILLTAPERHVSTIMDRRFVALKATDSQDAAVALFREHDRVALPVTDTSGVLIGIVTIDDVLHVAEAAATKEIQRIGGSEALDEPYLTIAFSTMVRKRAGWLTALFLGEMLTATAMGYYGDFIAKAVVLSFFIPLIISSGGNSGSQASTLVIRAMALGEVRLGDWWRIMRREIGAGLALGSILGVIGFLRITITSQFSSIYGVHWLVVAITVAVALIGVVLWGTLSGSLLPLLLKRLGFDPATSSAPFVATLVDVTGLVIYFSVALVIMRGTLL